MSAPVELALLLLWGTLTGLDLVSVPQGMISRPLVAGAVAGWLVGDAGTGVTVGLLLELFALESVAIGASRYPDYGAAAVGAAVAAAGMGFEGLGLGVALGLILAEVGGWSLQWLRHANARALGRNAASLEVGDPSALRRLQYGGLLRDAWRSLLLTAGALAAAAVIHRWPPVTGMVATLVTLTIIGGGLAAAGAGTMRHAGRGRRLAWLAAGAVVGLGWSWWR